MYIFELENDYLELKIIDTLIYFAIDDKLYKDLRKLFEQLHDVSKGHDTCNEYPSSEITEAHAALGHELTSSQVDTVLFIIAILIRTRVNHL